MSARTTGLPLDLPVVPCLVLSGVVLRLLLLIWARGTMIDDAYITLRCAENLLAGNGFVYNIGERVLCVTGPLYGFLVAGLTLLTGGRALGYVLGAVNIAAFAVSMVLLFHLTSQFGRKTAFFILVLFAFYPAFVDNATIGMETPLFVMGMLASLWLLTHRRTSWLSLVLGLLILVRPEGVLWCLAILTVLLVQGSRDRPARYLPGVAVLAVWAVASTAYYGSPIPHSMFCKCGLIVTSPTASVLSRAWSTFLSLSLLSRGRAFDASTPVGWSQCVLGLSLLACFLVGTVRIARAKSAVLAFPILYVAYILLYVVAKARLDFSWYGIPSGLACFVTASIGLAGVKQRLVGARMSGRHVGVGLAALAVLLIVVTTSSWRAGRLRYYRIMRTSYEAAGKLLDEVASPEARILVDEVGMIGYTARRLVWDLDGIVAPELMEFKISRGWWCPLTDIVEAFEPSHVVVSKEHARRLREEDTNGWVSANYATLAELPGHVVLARIDPGPVRRPDQPG